MTCCHSQCTIFEMLKDRKSWASDIGNELSNYPSITNLLMQPNKLQAYQFAQSWQTDFKYIDIASENLFYYSYC